MLELFKASGPLVLATLAFIGLLYQKLTSNKIDSLKSELTLASEQKTDAVLSTQQASVEQAIKQAEAPVTPPVLTPSEVIQELDKV